MKKILFIVSLLSLCFINYAIAQTPVPEDYFDLYDNEPSDDEGDSERENLKDINLIDLKNVFDAHWGYWSIPFY